MTWTQSKINLYRFHEYKYKYKSKTNLGNDEGAKQNPNSNQSISVLHCGPMEKQFDEKWDKSYIFLKVMLWLIILVMRILFWYILILNL